MSLTERQKIRLMALLALAAIVRAAYLFLYSADPIWGDLVVDSLYHLNWADSIAGGDVLGEEVYFRAPFYIYVLALLRAIGPDSILLPRVFGAALGVCSIALTYLLTLKVTSGERREAAALAAGALQALYPSVIYFEAELLVDFLFAFLLQLTVYLTVVSIQESNREAGGRGWVWVGLTLGLASVTRPTSLALLPIFAFLAWRCPAKTGLRARRSLALVLSVFAVVAPITLRNVVVGNDATLIASSGGINFYIGNNEESSPVSASLPSPLGPTWTPSDMIGLAEIREGQSLRPSQVSWSWTKLGLEWIISHPADFVTNCARKAHIVLGNRTYSNNRSLGSMFERNAVLRYTPLNFAILLTLAVLGGLAPARRRELAHTLGLAALYAAVVCLFFVTERFRLPALVLLFPAAGLGLTALWQSALLALRRSMNPDTGDPAAGESLLRPAPVSGLAATLAGVAFVLTLIPWGRPVENPQSRTKYLEANGHLAEGRLADAVTSFRELLAIEPTYPRAAQNLGVAYFLQSNADSAERYFLRELRLYPGAPDALTNLASLRLTRGDISAADTLSAQAYKIRPYDLTTFRLRIRTLERAGRRSESEALLLGAENLFSGQAGYWLDRGGHLLLIGDSAGALESFIAGAELDVTETDPVETGLSSVLRGDRQRALRQTLSAQTNYQAGYLLGLQRRLPESARYSSRAIARDSTLLAAYMNLALAYLGQDKRDSARHIRELAQKRFGPESRYGPGLRRLDDAFGD
ncbi:MAG: tetratricopeptide repeat protein [Candidatus Zixiibacteriota bacterium]